MDEYTAELFSGQDGGNDGDSRPLRSVEEAKPPVNLDTAKEENSPGLSLQDRLLARQVLYLSRSMRKEEYCPPTNRH